MKKKYYTDYYTAVHWCGNGIMCNNLREIDASLWGNMEFDLTYKENGNEYTRDIYQWLLMPWSQMDKDYMQKTFPELRITYSDLLDLWVVCVDHLGTEWRGVRTECRKDWLGYNKDKEYKG